jgi:hypothetical protein
MAMTSLKQVLQRIKIYQESHLQLNDFRFGDVTQHLSNGDIKYPSLFCDINPTGIDAEDKSIIFNLSFWVADLANVSTSTRVSEIEVLSDLTRIVQDLISLFKAYDMQDEWEIKTISNIDYFIEGNEDCAILAKFDIGFSLDYLFNYCSLPVGGSGSNTGFDYWFDFPLIDQQLIPNFSSFDYDFDFLLA